MESHAHTMGRKSKELLIITVLLNIAAIGWYGFLFAEVKAKNENTSGLLEKIEIETAAGNTLHAKKELVADTAGFRDELALLLVSKEGAVPFIELLETAGTGVGARVSIESIRVNEFPGSTTAEELELALQITGTWASVTRFVGLLELLPYRAEVRQVLITRGESSPGRPWEARVSLAVVKDK